MIKKILPIILIFLVGGIILMLIFNKNNDTKLEENKIFLTIDNTKLEVILEDNNATKELVKRLKEEDIIILGKEYGGFEKVGPLGFDLPKDDKKITTKPGDIVLYEGSNISLFYNSNSWSYTKIGHINIEQEKLQTILGDGDKELHFSID